MQHDSKTAENVKSASVDNSDGVAAVLPEPFKMFTHELNELCNAEDKLASNYSMCVCVVQVCTVGLGCRLKLKCFNSILYNDKQGCSPECMQ